MQPIPFIGTGKQDVRARIISVLSKKWPLSARDVFRKICEDAGTGGKPPTYQAVHKALLQLAAFEVVKREGTAYSLSRDWASQLKEFGERLEEVFIGNTPASIESLKQGESVSVCFDDTFVKPFYWLLGQVAMLSSPEKPVLPNICHHYHAWPMTVITEKEYAMLKAITHKRGHFVLCKGNSPIDKTVLRTWTDLGGKWKTNANCSHNCDLIVAQDFVFQIFQSAKTRKIWDAACAKAKTANQVDLSKLNTLFFETRAKTNIIITRNAELAEEIRKETISKFK